MKATGMAAWTGGSLTSRIVLAVVLSFMLPPAINLIIYFGIPSQPFKLFSAKWLIERTVQATRMIDGLPDEARLTALDILPLEPHLNASISDEGMVGQQPRETAFSGFGTILQAELERRLGPSGHRVVVSSVEPEAPFPFRVIRINFENIPPETPETLLSHRMLSLRAGDLPIPSTFIIDIRLRDGAWLTIQSVSSSGAWWQVWRMMVVVVSTVVLLGLVAYLVSRSLIRPITALGAAVENFGAIYVAEPVPVMGIAEYDRIASKFNQLQIQIATYLRERTQMIGAISHDLRTPLTRMRLFVEYLDDESIKKEAISSIEDMHLMIEDTLSYAKGLWAQERRSKADLAVMLITEVDSQTDIGRHAEYNGPAHAVLLCHPTALRRAFANLIENGIKYGAAVGVTLSIEGREIVVSIVDRGAGFAPGQIETAVAPFERLETSRSRETGGTGLGLTIARDVIARHGGSLTFRQLNGSGFEVRVRLPGVPPENQ